MEDTITFKDLEDRLKERENYEEIKKAYEYALNEHKGMKRLSGDNFITHPLEVTKILMDLNVDDTTIIGVIWLSSSVRICLQSSIISLSIESSFITIKNGISFKATLI